LDFDGTKCSCSSRSQSHLRPISLGPGSSLVIQFKMFGPPAPPSPLPLPPVTSAAAGHFHQMNFAAAAAAAAAAASQHQHQQQMAAAFANPFDQTKVRFEIQMRSAAARGGDACLPGCTHVGGDPDIIWI
jgi:hypothetical protein